MFPKNKPFKDRKKLDQAHTARCLICSREGCDPDHLISRGAGGGDEMWNIAHLCRQHHTERGQIGMNTFTAKYTRFKFWLFANGWYFCDVRNKWTHD